MDTHPTFGPNDVLAHIVGGMADAVSGRDGETHHQQHNRRETAAGTIMSFHPRDAIEAMLAGHCVMFHEMIVDSVNETLRGEDPATHRATRCAIVAMDKAFGDNLARLERYRARMEESVPTAQSSVVREETEIADRVRRHEAAMEPRRQADPEPAAPEGETILRYPSGDAIAGNPEPAGTAGLVPVPGGSQPVRSRPASASGGLAGHAGGTWAPVPPGDPRNGTGGNRQSRRHPNP